MLIIIARMAIRKYHRYLCKYLNKRFKRNTPVNFNNEMVRIIDSGYASNSKEFAGLGERRLMSGALLRWSVVPVLTVH
jgi:hypothetical protein